MHAVKTLVRHCREHVCRWGFSMSACGVQAFVESADASADPDLRVMAEAIIGALQE